MSNLKLQKTLTANAYGVGRSKVKIDFEQREEVKEAITKADIRSLVESGVIKITQTIGTSRRRARDRVLKRKVGRQDGDSKKKGKSTARTPKKRVWINKVRLQRKVLSNLKKSGKLATSDHRMLYLKSKGGFFRSKKHLTQYINQNKLLKKGVKK